MSDTNESTGPEPGGEDRGGDAQESDDAVEAVTTTPANGQAEDNGLPVDRRTLLGAGGALGLLGAGAYAYPFGDGEAPATTEDDDDDPEPSLETIPDDHVPFSVWEELQTALRASPDHRPGTAARLVEAGDPAAIFEFVRDDIATVPPDLDGSNSLETGTRWGADGTLRCGMGTPRDKADLLANLLADAGYESAVVAADEELTAEDVRDHYTRTIEKPFDPPLEESTVEDWADRLDGADGADDEFQRIDRDGADSAELVDSIRDAVPDPMDSRDSPEDFTWSWGSTPQDTPVVEFAADDEVRHANLFSGVPFGEAGASVSEISDRDDPEPVRVTLAAATPDTLEEPMELVSGTWDVHELVGAQLLVQTPVLGGPWTQPTATVGDVDLFYPALALQRPGQDPEQAIEGSVVGQPFSRNGEQLSIDPAGTVGADSEGVPDGIYRDGEPFVRAEGTDPDIVDSLTIEANPGDYPTVHLDVTPTDANGDPVPGLPAAAFAASDEGTDVMATMRRNAPEQTTVQVIRDTSASMPTRYRGDTGEEWEEALIERLAAHDVDVDVTTRRVDSRMWTHLTRAIADGPDLILYAHDGVNHDEREPWMEPLLEHAPPTVLFSAYDEESPVEDETVLEQASWTDAATAPMDEAGTIDDRVAAAVDSLATYRFEYHVPDEATGDREVTLTVGDDSVTDTDAYTVAETTHRNPVPRTLVGLYLTVEIGEDRSHTSVRRTLGGWDPDLDEAFDPLADADGEGRSRAKEYARDVHGALLGGVTLSFEGDGVPFGVALDDVLEARRSLAHIDEAVVEGDDAAVDEAIERGGSILPHDLLLVQSPLPDAATDEGVTYYDRPRIALRQRTPILGTDELEHSIDVLPLARARSTGSDPMDRFWRTLERTARVAVLEEAAFDTSTRTALEGADLVELSALDLESDRAEAFDGMVRASGFDFDAFQLCPSDGSALACWNVDHETGTITGVLDDGTGGGNSRERMQRKLDELSQIMSGYNLLITGVAAAGAVGAMGALSLGVVAMYGQQLARMYAAVALVLITMDTGHLEEQARNAIAQMACEVAQDITLGSFSVFGDLGELLGTILGIADDSVGMFGGSTPFSCDVDL